MSISSPPFLRRFLFLNVILGGVFALTGLAFAAPPSNDSFSAAAALNGLPASAAGTNAEASLEPGEPDETEGYGGKSVWWAWTAPSAGWVEVNTLGSDFDTVLAIYTGESFPSLSLIKWNDETANISQSRVRFQASAGVIYRIQVQGWEGDEGVLKLEIRATDAPRPPVLQRITFLTPSVDVTTADAVATAEVQFTAPDSLSGIDVSFKDPGGDEIPGGYGFQLISGTLEAGVCRVQSNISAHRTPGVWRVEVDLYDESGEEARYGGAGEPPLPEGSAGSITLINTGAVDSKKPEITAAALSPASVDVTSGSQSLTVTITAADDLEVVVINPYIYDLISGEYLASTAYNSSNRISGDLKLGVYVGQIVIPAFTAPGQYRVEYSLSRYLVKIV